MEKSLIDVGKRCLQCDNPRCSKGCPVNTSIKDMINIFLNSEIKAVEEILFKNN